MQTNTAEEQEIEIIDSATLEMAAECLRTIAHPCRLQIIGILMQQECSVGELADFCNIPSNMASEHLRLLKDRGLLSNRRVGRKIFHAVAEPALASIIHCIKTRFSCGEQEIF